MNEFVADREEVDDVIDELELRVEVGPPDGVGGIEDEEDVSGSRVAGVDAAHRCQHTSKGHVYFSSTVSRTCLIFHRISHKHTFDVITSRKCKPDTCGVITN